MHMDRGWKESQCHGVGRRAETQTGTEGGGRLFPEHLSALFEIVTMHMPCSNDDMNDNCAYFHTRVLFLH